MQTKSLLISAILLVSILGFIAPAVPAFGSTGHASLDAVNSLYVEHITAVQAATTSVGVYAGTSTVAQVDGTTPTVSPAYLAINLTGITFSGAQFDIYLSPNGFSQINTTTDILVAGAFAVSAVTATPTNVTATVGSETGKNYSIGAYNPTTSLIEGPMPTNIPGGHYFIKIYDGSSSSVAVSLQELIILPAVEISLPGVTAGSALTGPAGGAVTLTGSGFSANGIVNITAKSSLATKDVYSKNITADSIGEFTWSSSNDTAFKAADLGATFSGTPVSGSQGTLTYKGYDWGTAQTSATALYTEAFRQFSVAKAFNPGTGLFSSASGTAPYGNYSAGNPSVNGYVTYLLEIQGNFFNPSSQPSFTFTGFGGATSAITPTAITAINSTGAFSANFTVPVAPKGQGFLSVYDSSGNLSLGVNVQTTLAISPSSGPEGTSVSVSGYGFTATSNVTVWWLGISFTNPVNPATNNALLYNSTVPSSGSFSFTFSVPNDVYGGNHSISANSTAPDYAAARFFVSPSFSLSTTTAALGTLTTFTAQGLAVGNTSIFTTDPHFAQVNASQTGATGITYTVSYDNALLSNAVKGNVNGTATYPVIAAGVPMVHYVGVVYLSPITGTYTALTPIGLNVTGSTTEGAEIISLLQSYQSQTMSQLNSLSSSVSSLSSQVTNGFTSVNSAISALSSKVDTVQSTLGSVQTQTAGIAGVASSLGNATTYLLVAVVLAAIVLVLEIVILVRKK